MNDHTDARYEDIYLGRIGRQFLSVDIVLTATHTRHWNGRVIWYPGGEQAIYRGAFIELRAESRIRWFGLHRPPIRYVDGLNLDAWRTDEWVTAPHIHPWDLRRLQEIVTKYSRNVVTVEPGHSPINEVLLIPTAIIAEIDQLAERLVPATLFDNAATIAEHATYGVPLTVAQAHELLHRCPGPDIPPNERQE